jgi:hypothetical protein
MSWHILVLILGRLLAVAWLIMALRFLLGVGDESAQCLGSERALAIL